MKHILSDNDKKILNKYVSSFREVGIKSDFKIFLDEDAYTIFFTDKSDFNNHDESINTIFNKLDKKYYSEISKIVLIDYLYNFFVDDESIKKYLDSEIVIDITNEIEDPLKKMSTNCI